MKTNKKTKKQTNGGTKRQENKETVNNQQRKSEQEWQNKNSRRALLLHAGSRIAAARKQARAHSSQ